MARPRRLYDTAHLAGGPARVVDTALVALAERGALILDSAGTLTVPALTGPGRPAATDPVERVVLEVVRDRAPSGRDEVLARAARHPELLAQRRRLAAQGLLAAGPLARLRAALSGRPPLTADGRRRLAQAARPDGSGAAAAVAVGGLGALPDAELRAALLGAYAARDARAHPGTAGDGGGGSSSWGDDGGGAGDGGGGGGGGD